MMIGSGPGPERPSFGTNGIIGLLIAAAVLFVLINLISWVVSLLYKIAALFFVAAAIIDHTVITDYAKSIYRLFQRNWVLGLVAGGLSIVLYPFTGLFLLGKALFRKQLEKKVPGYKKAREEQRERERRRRDQYTEFEEVPRNAPTDDDFIDFEELPPAREPEPEPLPRKEKKEGEDYDELFR